MDVRLLYIISHFVYRRKVVFHMAKEKLEKTNAIRILEREQIPYQHRSWEKATKEHTGVELAAALGQPPEQVFKTLVTVGKSGEHYVFMLPVAAEYVKNRWSSNYLHITPQFQQGSKRSDCNIL